MVPDLISIPQMSNDPRIRVFRRNFVTSEEGDSVEVDMYAIISSRYVILCDTLLCPEDMALVMHELRADLAGRQLLVINSHADWDHAWGNCYFTGEQQAMIIAHEHCYTRLQSAQAQQELADLQRLYPLFHNVVLEPPTLTFADTLTIAGGDLTLELFSAPGHCPDQIAAWIPELHLLLAFDAAENPFPVLANAAGVQPMFSTLEHFLALQPERVLCSHGRSTCATIIEHNLAYLRQIEQRCLTFLSIRYPTETELKDAASLIAYTFDDALAEFVTLGETINRTFYSEEHENNIRAMMHWLIRE